MFVIIADCEGFQLDAEPGSIDARIHEYKPHLIVCS
jgi:hypothetical protein